MGSSTSKGDVPFQAEISKPGGLMKWIDVVQKVRPPKDDDMLIVEASLGDSVGYEASN